jgi:hypothetical protein
MATRGRKGQGLPLNVIVIAAIAILVLVIVIMFATGSMSKLFGGTQLIGTEVTPNQISSFKIGCNQACFSAQQLANTESDWKTSEYCQRTLSGIGKCWDANVTCTKNETILGVEKSFGPKADKPVLGASYNFVC